MIYRRNLGPWGPRHTLEVALPTYEEAGRFAGSVAEQRLKLRLLGLDGKGRVADKK